MTNRRILISHSIRAGHPGKSLRDAVEKALRNTPDFEPLLDEQAFRTGIPWRLVNDEWIWGCDGAVLLLSQSALESAYVRYEAQVLRQRWLVHKRDFPFVIVRFPEVTKTDLSKTLYAPLQLDEVQQIYLVEPDSLNDAAGIASKTMEALEPLVEQGRLKPRHPLEDRVFRLLYAQAASNPAFKDLCKAELDDAIEASSERLMALQATRALFDRYLSNGKPALKHFTELIEGLSPIIGRENTRIVLCTTWPFWWVDEKAAAQFAFFDRDDDTPALGWSRVWPLSVEMHVMRAFHRKNVVLVGTSDASGSDAEQSLAHARACLSKELRIPQKLPPTLADTKIVNAIEKHRAEGRPVFLLLRPTDLDRETAERYRETWQGIRLFVDCGYEQSELLNTPGLSWVQQVEPALDLDIEVNAADVWSSLMESQGQKVDDAYDETLELLRWL